MTSDYRRCQQCGVFQKGSYCSQCGSQLPGIEGQQGSLEPADDGTGEAARSQKSMQGWAYAGLGCLGLCFIAPWIGIPLAIIAVVIAIVVFIAATIVRGTRGGVDLAGDAFQKATKGNVLLRLGVPVLTIAVLCVAVVVIFQRKLGDASSSTQTSGTTASMPAPTKTLAPWETQEFKAYVNRNDSTAQSAADPENQAESQETAVEQHQKRADFQEFWKDQSERFTSVASEMLAGTAALHNGDIGTGMSVLQKCRDDSLGLVAAAIPDEYSEMEYTVRHVAQDMRDVCGYQLDSIKNTSDLTSMGKVQQATARLIPDAHAAMFAARDIYVKLGGKSEDVTVVLMP